MKHELTGLTGDVTIGDPRQDPVQLSKDGLRMRLPTGIDLTVAQMAHALCKVSRRIHHCQAKIFICRLDDDGGVMLELVECV
jgi:hypothetical protein